MFSKTKILFIINPIAGRKSKDKLPAILDKHLDLNRFDYEIRHTEYKGHGEILARETDADWVFAVGGDGTVSEVGRGVLGTNKALGILPCGSGDGLALHLGISRNFIKAVKEINRSIIIVADHGLINDEPFFCTCGVGLDAIVSEKFAQSGERGLSTYLQKALQTWKKFEPQTYTITIDGEKLETPAVLITVANANQWGNNGFIAPGASICDSLLDVTIITPFNSAEIPILATQLLDKGLNRNPRVKEFKAHEITILRQEEGPAHYDGDPMILGKEINISIVPQAMKIITPMPKPGRI